MSYVSDAAPYPIYLVRRSTFWMATVLFGGVTLSLAWLRRRASDGASASHSSSGRARASRRSVSHLRSRQLGGRPDPHRPQILPAGRSGGRRVLRRGTGVRPCDERAPVDRGVAARDGAAAGRVRARRSTPRAIAAPLEPLVHRWIRGRDLVALLLILQRMLREAGSVEQFFLRRRRRVAAGRQRGARLVFRTGAARRICARRTVPGCRSDRVSATSFLDPQPAAPASA